MGDGSDGTDVSPESEATAAATAVKVKGAEIWGTLEELLLACAVTRHGTASWDSVAMEVQTRSPVAARPGLTPHSCRLRFRHLHRRFSAAVVGSAGEETVAEAEAEEDPDASAAEGWVDELRRLRVAELRRDVERCDLSIGTLQSKVKRLREERERTETSAGECEAKPDEVSANDRLSSEEPGLSCRESNSTDLKPPKHPGHQDGSGGGSGGKEEEVAKQEASVESAAAAAASKESSDVRSSASLCRRRESGSGGKADEDEEAASAARPPPARPPPLASSLVDAVSAKLGPVLQRLREHDSEESAAYRGTIRRHVDLESVRRRLDASAACSRAADDDPFPARELYRDLLLLCTNAAVFFPRGTPEHAAAVEARALVTGHASAALHEPKQEHAAVAAAPAAPGADIVGSLIGKGKPLIVCRKRSSIAKAAASAARKEESTTKGEAEVATAAAAEESGEDEKKSVAAATKDKAWGVRTKKSRGGKNSTGPGRNLTKAEDDADGSRKGGPGGLAKKRNAVDFLKRLNQSPQRKRGSGSKLGTTRKRSAAAMEQQTTTTRKRGTGRREGTGRGGSRRGGRGAGTKRGVGRPQKRGPGPATPPPSKRAKTNSRSEKSSGTGKRGGRR